MLTKCDRVTSFLMTNLFSPNCANRPCFLKMRWTQRASRHRCARRSFCRRRTRCRLRAPMGGRVELLPSPDEPLREPAPELAPGTSTGNISSHEAGPVDCIHPALALDTQQITTRRGHKRSRATSWGTALRTKSPTPWWNHDVHRNTMSSSYRVMVHNSRSTGDPTGVRTLTRKAKTLSLTCDNLVSKMALLR